MNHFYLLTHTNWTRADGVKPMSLQINTYFQRVFSSDVTDIRSRERPTPDTKNPKHCTHGDLTTSCSQQLKQQNFLREIQSIKISDRKQMIWTRYWGGKKKSVNDFLEYNTNLVEVQLHVRSHICLLLWQLFCSFLHRALSVIPKHSQVFMYVFTGTHVCSHSNA